jgi:transcriptional regulator NrdR family protein
MSYEAAKKRAEPYTKIVEELPQMRRKRRCTWCGKRWVQAVARMCWSIIALRGMRH